MSEAAALQKSGAPQKLITELKVTAHLMNLETGLFCILQTPGARHEPDAAGLPGVRVTLPPNAPKGVSIASFRPDGWMSGVTDAAVVRVSEPAAQILVTIYQNIASTDPAPRLQVIRLSDEMGGAPKAPAAEPAARAKPEVVAHVQVKGDVGAMIGDWIGDRGSKRWIEGFMVIPQSKVAAEEIEYQAVLGRGWLSPWSDGGQLCGSRGMSLPILGLRARIKGDAAETHVISYEATFIDGSTAGPVGAGEACEAESLSPMEAFCITISELAGAAQAKAPAPAARATKPAAKAPMPKAPPAKAPPPPVRKPR